jgi:hypothetical protein
MVRILNLSPSLLSQCLSTTDDTQKKCSMIPVSVPRPWEPSPYHLLHWLFHVPPERGILLGRFSTTWATPPVHYAFVILGIGSHVLARPAWNVILLFMLPCLTGIIAMSHQLGQLGTVILPISAFGAARIAGEDHCAWPHLFFCELLWAPRNILKVLYICGC